MTSSSATPPRSTNATTNSATTSQESKMLFGRKAAARRRVLANSNALTEYEADLTSKDRAKQKEAVRKYLDEHIKTDWKWDWPPKTSESAEAEEIPIEGTVTIEEDWREREEWESNASESDEDPTSPKGPVNINSPEKESAFRFDSPDGVGVSIQKRAADRKRRRKKRLAEEIKWNDGARCFAARRNAWTCARQVPPSSKRALRVKTNQTITSLAEDGSSTAADDEYSSDEEWDTEIPIAGPLLPPDNAMRASITPSAYSMIYDKVVVQALTPSCPMNLRDVTRSCVEGWKRDGEWPPRPSVVEQAGLVKKRNQRRLSLANILGLDRTPGTPEPRLDLGLVLGNTAGAGPESPGGLKSPTTPGGSIKKGLQKILSFGHDSAGGKKS
ncbi:mitochondrial AAA ATPase protein [Rutstroemia sp. NJR-2017a BVV2]|nr:mitochondrial AAA ATPase protein [Rutstroemia sp. NJR-2017a BVV2]